MSHTGRCAELGYLSVYKSLKDKASVPTHDLISLVRRCRNDHSMAYQVPIANTNIYSYRTVCTKTSSSWDDSHKQIFFTGTIHQGRFAQMVKMWNKKFLIENFKLQQIVNILIFTALLQIKLFSIFQIRKLFCLIFIKIYWNNSPGMIHPNFRKGGWTSFPLEILKWCVDVWNGW